MQYGMRLWMIAWCLGSVLLVGCGDMPRSHSWRDASVTVTETKALGTSWEKEFGLVQGVQSGSLVFLSGQLGLDENGMIVGTGSLDTQMRQAYANVAKALQLFNLTMNDVLEETIYVMDMPVALTISPKVRRDVYATPSPAVASTVVQVQRLAFAEALVEIRVVAKAKAPAHLRPADSPSEDAPRRRGGRGRGGFGGGMGGGLSPY